MRVPAWAFLSAAAAVLAAAAVPARRLARHGRWGATAIASLLGVALAGAVAAGAAPMLGRPGLPRASRLAAIWTEPVRWLSDPRTSIVACVLPMPWAGVGPGSIVNLAAMKTRGAVRRR